MKCYLVLLFCGLSYLDLNAQTFNDVGKIALSVVMPERLEEMNQSNISKLNAKITQVVSASGLSASGFNHNFVIYPVFHLNESNIIETGSQDLTVVTCEMSLYIKQVDNNVIFSTFSKQYKGTGKQKDHAISNAISKIDVNDIHCKAFILHGKQKIYDYYVQRCGDIIKQADTYVKMQQYEQAVGLLLSVPSEVPCYASVQTKAVDAFKAFSNQRCSTQLQEVKSLLAANNFESALSILGSIDPSAQCFKESQSLINKAAASVNAEQRRQWEYQMKQYNDEVSLEKMRINAVRDMAVAYYQNRPKTVVSYNVLIR